MIIKACLEAGFILCLTIITFKRIILKTIYAIPGLSTTKELFRFLKIEGAEIIVLDWPTPRSNETMQTYAAEIAKQIVATKPFYLLGVSFGGMLCVEISKIVSAEKIFLISSAKNSNELPSSIKCFKYFPIHKIIPESLNRALGRNVRRIVGFEKIFLPEFVKMVNSMPAGYFRSSFKCVINWKSQPGSNENIIHMHGDADKLLPHKFVKAEYIIKGGNHAMIVYKADEISKIINTILSE